MSQFRPQEKPPRKRMSSIGIFLFLVIAATIATITFAGWGELYTKFLEVSPPRIIVSEVPRGIGLIPVSLTVEISDTNSGLDEVIIRSIQRDVATVMRREALHGRSQASISIDFAGEKSGLEEGDVYIEIKAFDRSFWNNAAQHTIALEVDYHRPKLEVLSTQHNARKGGSQLVLYNAYDENVAISGVKVGTDTFLGFPARGVDKDFNDNNLYAALYSVSFYQNTDKSPVKVFAEDEVGNAASVTFYNKVQRKSQRRITYTLSDGFLRGRISDLADANFTRLEKAGKEISYQNPRGSRERLLEKFHLVNQELRSFNNTEILSLLKGARFERYFTQPFMRQPGRVSGMFGDVVGFHYAGQLIGEALRTGYQIIPSPQEKEALAANDGIVLFCENLGVFGHTIAIDHGLALVSLYSFLSRVFVSPGEAVKSGQPIGEIGDTGLTPRKQLHFEIRINGVPVDPREWWDRNWYYNHITSKINNVKRQLGISIYDRGF